MESKSVRLTISELPWAIRVTLLTLYIALVNSYALGVVYPSLKTDDFMSHLINLVVYIGLIVPLIILAFKSLKRKTNLRTLISGFIVFVIAMAVTSNLHLQSP